MNGEVSGSGTVPAQPAAMSGPADAAPLRIGDLLRPQAFPHAVSALRLRETHVSWVVLTGRFAYKIKKPVRFPFIDATTLAQRLHFCREELRLNRRLAPELYLDVVPVTRADGCAMIDGPGPVIDYAVRMRQFGEADEMPSLLEEGAVSVGDCSALGELLARFHRSVSVDAWTGGYGHTGHMHESILGNLAQLADSNTQPAVAPMLERLADWMRDRVTQLDPALRRRERSGFVRECHGDLHCGNIVRSLGRLTPFDCIEFDPRLRWIDVMNDVAFLVMDLFSRRRAGLAMAMLSQYLETSGDYQGVRLLPFYATHRALVRALVDRLSAEQLPARADEFRRRMRERIEAAASWTGRPAPALLLMHGLSGSGKSWLSERLVPAVPAIRLRSDVERKRLAGLQPAVSSAAPLRQGLYAHACTRRTYRRLAGCAAICLRAGFHVIVDATFLEAKDREVFAALAERLNAPSLLLSCHADPETLEQRIRKRAMCATDASDADLDVLAAQLQSAQPLSSTERARALLIDTSEPEVAERVAAAVQARLACFPGTEPRR
ncbi:MAG: hypothetical protein CMLOHMNK_00181 [Steroidobacteraceae bacterium]|nr:hypothetical protein [Steroidobacteraceae bacterium]